METTSVLLAFVEDWLNCNGIPVHRVALPCSDFSWLDYGMRAAIMKDRAYAFFEEYFASVEENTVYNLSDLFGCRYTVFILPGCKERMVCGPVLLEDVVFSCPESIAKRLRLPSDVVQILQGYYARFITLSMPVAYYNLFRTLGSYIFGQDSLRIVNDGLDDIEHWCETYQRECYPSELAAATLHMVEDRYHLETQLMDAIMRADEFGALAVFSKMQMAVLPSRLDDKLRDVKNLMIVGNTLCRKAAQTAGVHPALIDACSNRNAELVEKITGKGESIVLMGKFIHDYCSLIGQQTLNQYSLLTKKAISYINLNLASNLRLSAVSEQLNVSAGYLSGLFRREVGIPLTDYVNGRRISLAKKLLLTSDMPIKEIAQRCGIPDIYYFSRQFKKRTGYTPKAYRKKPL